MLTMALKKIGVIYLFIGTIWLTTSYASMEYNRYLTQIFKKYGSENTISFEGLEHLMYSLGLGHIKFDPMHTIEEHRPKDYNLTTPETISKNTPPSKTDDDVIDVKLSTPLENKPINQIEPNNQTASKRFYEMHDPKHRHPRESRVSGDETSALPETACLSPKSLLSLLVDHNDLHRNKLYRQIAKTEEHNLEEEYNEFINSVLITPNAFMKLCPVLLAQIDNGVCMQPAPRPTRKHEMVWNAWIYASISMFILSACGLLGILLVPLMKSVAYQEILKFLVAIAVGTLAGDALMHLLPHALFKEEKHEHELETMNAIVPENQHKHNNEAALLCGCTFLAALAMYILENVIPIIRGKQHGHAHSHGHSHAHSHGHSNVHSHSPSPGQINAQDHSHSDVSKITTEEASGARELNIMLSETKLDQKKPGRSLTPVAFMVIIGDGLHNLTDGLAIGAAFASNHVAGLATALAVLCHELPHELGDFALLLQTGVPIRRAIYMNIISSVLSFVGMSIGLLLVSIGDGMTQWIYAATAGTFLYIAFADLVPTMSVAHNPEFVRDKKGIFLQIFGIFLGGLIMLIIAINEDDLQGLFKDFN